MIPGIWYIVVPVAAALMAAWVFVKGWADPKRVLAASPPLAAGGWLLWGVWETEVVGPDDNIRVDLVLLGPLLLSITLLAILAMATARRRRPDG